MSVYPGRLVVRYIEGARVEQIQPAGVDLTVNEIYEFSRRGIISIEGVELPQYRLKEFENGRYVLKPGAYLVRFGEIIKVPSDCVGIFLPRSSLLRMGATIQSALWDPGYEGRGVGLLIVMNPQGIVLEKGARIAQFILMKMVEPPERVYCGSYQREGM
ncbi:MAG: deoxyuridine 5'-triphosphate nucleotidohydrolase [Thermoprotei archaeon]|nr:MAG: deoxyuridine 5'-triphosphate nucleotidohydrolase [Thermoprotei archaeon]RLE87728.1 MAG: deoxyuridine 5'-triphosphate nucleotidohydrolase [Thermoprotei archaeon]